MKVRSRAVLGIVVSSCLGGEGGRGRKQEFQSPEVTSCRWVGAGSGVASKLCPHQLCTQSMKAGAGEGGTERLVGSRESQPVIPCHLWSRDSTPHPLTRHRGALGWRQQASCLVGLPTPPSRPEGGVFTQHSLWKTRFSEPLVAALRPCTSKSFCDTRSQNTKEGQWSINMGKKMEFLAPASPTGRQRGTALLTASEPGPDPATR